MLEFSKAKEYATKALSLAEAYLSEEEQGVIQELLSAILAEEKQLTT